MVNRTMLRKAVELIVVPLLGGSFFFVIIGVFGLSAAIAGLVVFIVGAVTINLFIPEERAGQ